MANFLSLRWTKAKNYWESNLVKLNSQAFIQVQLDSEDGVDISYLLSLSGDTFVSIAQDYFAKLHIRLIPVPGLGQVMKFRINKLPDYSVILGDDIEDAGDTTPEEDKDVVNGFAGMEGEYFRCRNTEIFVGRNK